MSRGPSSFKQADLARALRAAKAAGQSVCRYEITADGTIRVFIGEPDRPEYSTQPGTSNGANEWDGA